MTYRFKQCVDSIVFKYFNEQCANCLNEVFDVVTESNFQLKGSFQNLKCLFRKINTSQLTLSSIAPKCWNETLDKLKHIHKFLKQSLKFQ